ncbi:MAG: class I SAM-dependent methyltransferase [Algicola sp.]|nr:class I SAM-dependent methyltransferase [Algicola sp.]
MMFQLTQYLKFLLHATNQHDVHSPFVYQLITQCLYDKTPYAAYGKLKNYRQALLKNQATVSITDLGPGSKRSKTSDRKIATIARHSGSSLAKTKLLYRLTQYFKCRNSLELGTSLGLATQALGIGDPTHRVTTIEGCPNLTKLAQQNLKAYPNVSCINGSFAEVLTHLPKLPYDLVFFDGNHTQKATLSYFETLLPHTHNDTVFIFDDINWSPDMAAAWELIKTHPKVTVTIDTFLWGLVFFRKEQAKQDFKIRLPFLF